MLILAKVHFQIVEPVLESLEERVTLRAFSGCGRRTEDQGSLRMLPEVEDFIFQLLELLRFQPHPFAGLTVVDLNLVPDCWNQVRVALRTFQLCLRLNGFITQCSEINMVDRSQPLPEISLRLRVRNRSRTIEPPLPIRPAARGAEHPAQTCPGPQTAG